jgi:hypothetical protein
MKFDNIDDIKMDDIEIQDDPVKDLISIDDKRNSVLEIDGLTFKIIADTHILKIITP